MLTFTEKNEENSVVVRRESNYVKSGYTHLIVNFFPLTGWQGPTDVGKLPNCVTIFGVVYFLLYFTICLIYCIILWLFVIIVVHYVE